jgi:hypothetical protein
MPCKYLWWQVREVERAIGALRPHIDIPGVTDATRELFSIRGRLLKTVGLKYPRTISSILKLAALSPGSITLWHDVESGWMVEAREKPGVPPVYHYVGDDTAVAILSGKLTHELEAELMKPDEYLGE